MTSVQPEERARLLNVDDPGQIMEDIGWPLDRYRCTHDGSDAVVIVVEVPENYEFPAYIEHEIGKLALNYNFRLDGGIIQRSASELEIRFVPIS